MQEDAERLSEDLQGKHLQPVAMLVNKIVDEYAKANNLAVVIDPSTEKSNIVFAAKSSDITNEVIRMMNAAYAKDPKITAPNLTAPAGAPRQTLLFRLCPSRSPEWSCALRRFLRFFRTGIRFSSSIASLKSTETGGWSP